MCWDERYQRLAWLASPINCQTKIHDEPNNDHCSYHIKTRLLICEANQLTGFYMMGKNTIDRNLLIAYEKTHYIIDKILVKLQ